MRRLFLFLFVILLVACSKSNGLKNYAISHWNLKTKNANYKEIYVDTSVVILNGNGKWYGAAIDVDGDTVEILTDTDFYSNPARDVKRADEYFGKSEGRMTEVLTSTVVTKYLDEVYNKSVDSIMHGLK